ncbi:MAG: T9SS type A sorting domain-containing protein [Flavobacterium sp.]
MGTLTANQNGASYQWYECPDTLLTGETNQSFTPAVSGNYKVVLTIGSCSDESDCTEVLDNENFIKNVFLLYPNPTTGIINIATQENLSVAVYDLVGKIIIRQEISSGTSTLDISNYARGVYVVKATNTSGNEATYKIVKQ